MNNTYGSCNKDICHTDTSMTERGVKVYATRRGLNNVSVRYNSGYVVQILQVKVNDKWVVYDKNQHEHLITGETK